MKRRDFIRYAGAGGLVFPAILRSASLSPNSRLQMACVGMGNKGIRDFALFLGDGRVDVVAICDVDAKRLEQAAALAPGARLYADWRELLEKESGRLDSVHIATPDHMHASIALTALLAGKHVYCQKPLCHDVKEVRLLTEVAAHMGVVTQLGTQLASGLGDRRAVQLLQEKAIGTVKHVYIRVPDTTLQWDPQALQFPNHRASNKYLSRTYRDGWHIEGLG